MQRHWRSKPSKELIKLMEESVDIRLYLVQEKGPLSMVFQDDSRKKYSITIGDQISCSCGGGKVEHCIHTLYVLNRIFKINFDDTLILQLNYTDSELSKMINTRNSENSIRNRNTKNIGNNLNNRKTDNFNERGNRMNLYDDITCPICQEDMYSLEGLFYCVNSCGHNFHNHCLKVWGEHKKSTSDIISCPMCRAEWNEDEMKKNSLKFVADKGNPLMMKRHKSVNCKNCSRINIKCERFHCLNCENHDLCVECYNLGLHQTGHSFIVKKHVDDKWVGVDTRLSGSTVSGYSAKSIKLSQFLISLLVENDKNSGENSIPQDINSLNETDLNRLKCVICKSDRSSSLQLLKLKVLPSCKHLVHFKCAENLFKFFNDSKGTPSVDKIFNTCMFDKLPIFPGLNSIGFKVREFENKGHIEKVSNDRLQSKSKNQISNGFMIKKSLSNKSNIRNTGGNNMNLGIGGYGNSSLKKSITPLISVRKHGSNNSNMMNLALNIRKVDFKTDAGHESENMLYNYNGNVNNKDQIGRLKNIRKIHSMRPQKKSGVKMQNKPEDKSENFQIKPEVVDSMMEDQLQNDVQFNKMKMANKGIKVVDLKIRELKVKYASN